jgi:hypothetical protein
MTISVRWAVVSARRRIAVSLPVTLGLRLPLSLCLTVVYPRGTGTRARPMPGCWRLWGVCMVRLHVRRKGRVRL